MGVRGWLRILEAIRKAKPDMVMDHRQIAHKFNPWYHLAGSYSELIAGDENPESYGAELASLSTDHILADNLRLANYRYRLQLLPNDRVPGFMFHQTERHFDNGTGSDSMGRSGDKFDKNGNALWKPDAIPDADGNWQGVTYGNCVVDRDWHTRDFDYLGYRYSVISTLGTAGRNLVVANVPARNLEEYEKFPKEDISWIRKWFDWADDNGGALRRTMPLLGHERPRLGQVDGSVAVVNDEGFVFLYNPSPDSTSATIRFDETLGLEARAGNWLVSEIYPREDGMPLGVWQWQDFVTFSVSGHSARVLQLSLWKEELIAFNVSYRSIVLNEEAAIVISDAEGLAGSVLDIVVHVPPSVSCSSLIINDKDFPVTSTECHLPLSKCITTTARFGGSTSLRHNARAGPAPKNSTTALYSANIMVTSAMLDQLQERQAKYNISWLPEDLDASWLAPSRLLLYTYVARPNPSLADPVVVIDGQPVVVTRQYNSRGNHAIVPSGGGAVSGETAWTFLGWYVDCSQLEPNVAHELSLKFSWSDSDREAHPFFGIYWHNIEDSLSGEVGFDLGTGQYQVP